MRSKRIYILAPNDRFNYGDLIFPYIVKERLSDITNDFVFCSTFTSDLSEKGGIPTVGFKDLYRMDNKDDNYLVIAGGESLFSPWGGICSFVDKGVAKFSRLIGSLCYHLHIRHLIPGFYIDNIITMYAKRKFKFKTQFPFTIAKSEIKNLNGVYYNSVGNVSLLTNKYLYSKRFHDILCDSDYISVRDEKTSKYLDNMHIDHKLVPDSAILMSDVFSEEFLVSKIEGGLSTYCKSAPYIFFQINLGIWTNNSVAILEQIRHLLSQTETNIVLCPIGTALGHSDNIALNEIYDRLSPNKKVRLVHNPTLWEIMWLIKNCNLYIGTSLHGAITAMSWGVPYLSHTVGKVKAYIDYWGKNSEKHFSSISSLSDFALRLLTNEEKENADNQKLLVRESLDTIHDMILKN